MTRRADLVAAAGDSIAKGSKSFRFASQLFDEPTRERAWLLYAWCRACDDITDGQTLGHDATTPADPMARLDFVREKTAMALAGEATGLVPFDALGQVAAECAIHPALADHHLAGFARDAAGWQPQTQDDLLSYCYQVAGAVGVMMAQVMGVPAEDVDTLDRASDLGLAFQLANIARDVIDDARVGRCYLPRQWLAEVAIEQIDPDDPDQRARLAPLAHRLATLADRYRASARVGAARLPLRSRWAVLAAARIYGRIAERARAAGPRAWDRRIIVAKREKLRLVAWALGDALLPPPAVERRGLWTRPSLA
ncbi:phytoene/squalene synthase family protein [Sphingomicrobium astaxanthinifaciens]|uniref:phytoene/squalene synthase family protein n=1 Tax=Sphingomicrobium astaxanthinifaciens TaxID=1227949 RepID=UPI001FCBAF25|nr:phytoene/squalene synthase family protein [Sphingomicrobium astaxanthinifaciens]MCJ7420747.1 phytoene/squalene synthase family protein [Sphingomicrobium astaxanthinifaciens]